MIKQKTKAVITGMGAALLAACSANPGAAQAGDDAIRIADMPRAESVLYDPASDRLIVSVMGSNEPGDGFLSTIALDGTVIERDFVTGLDDPKGSVIVGNTLWVADNTVLAEIDLETREITRHPAEGAEFLNDVTADARGNIYVSDTRQSVIYRFWPTGEAQVWLDHASLNSPNGLLVEGDTMYVASWGERANDDDDARSNGQLLTVDMTSRAISTVSAGAIGNLDGVQRAAPDRLMVSEWWGGDVWLVDETNGLSSIVQEPDRGVGDIYFNPATGLLALPMNGPDEVLLYSITP